MSIFARSHKYNGPRIEPGSVVKTFHRKANKDKWYLVLGKSGDGILCLTVLINTKKPFQENKYLASLQFHLSASSVSCLNHDSYVNCAHPTVISLQNLQQSVTNNSKNYIGNVPVTKLDEIRTIVANAKIVEKKTVNNFGLTKFKLH